MKTNIMKTNQFISLYFFSLIAKKGLSFLGNFTIKRHINISMHSAYRSSQYPFIDMQWNLFSPVINFSSCFWGFIIRPTSKNGGNLFHQRANERRSLNKNEKKNGWILKVCVWVNPPLSLTVLIYDIVCQESKSQRAINAQNRKSNGQISSKETK